MKIDSIALLDAYKYLGEKHFSSFDISSSECDDPAYLKIKKEGKKIHITYGQLTSFFRALSLIKEHRDEESYEREFHKRFLHNGVMHDCSRNGPLNIKKMKEYILVHALFGMNRFLLYIEDLYEIEGEPYFGYLRGRYTKEEIKEVVDYASLFGIEIVPCIQTLSHLNQALPWEVYAPIRETNQTLLMGEPKTYEFIEKMISTIKGMFKTNVIHIGMDEAFDLGMGRFLYENKLIDKTQEFLKHLNKVVDICHKYGLKPMMWEDMFFHLSAKNSNWYDNKTKLSDEVKALIPDVGLVYWDYYNIDPKAYDNKFIATLDTGKEAIYAGGAISWIGFAPNILQSMHISEVGLKSAVRNGIKEVFITSWGDNGNEAPIISPFPTMALFSMYDYEGKGNKKSVSSLLKAVTGDDLKLWSAMQQVNHVRKEILPYESPSKAFIYMDPLLGKFEPKIKEEYEEVYKRNTRIIRSAQRRSEKYSLVYKTLADLSSVLEIKTCLGLKMRKAYKEGNKEALEQCMKDIKKCIKRLDTFRNSYRERWFEDNKASGFEVVDGRLGFVRSRLESTYIRLNDYLLGKIDRIEELEYEKLPHDCAEKIEEIAAFSWAGAASVNLI
ncbi:MAG: beta-N-acetylhexosaminidase [Bacilli bacterium]|nr:beta-N-acetylhexosaminidase [Bacilli bacterium]